MVITSPSYQENIKATIREITAKAQWGFVDVNARENATVTSNGENTYSKINQVTDGNNAMSNKIATLEENLWKLDGTFDLMYPNNDYQLGYWSNAMSNAQGEFVNNPLLTVTLSASASAIGLTLCFDTLTNDCPADFIITYYQGATVLQTISVTNNTKALYVNSTPIQNYNKITIEFVRTSKPYRFIKLSEIIFGIIQSYADDEIVSIKFVEPISPFNDTLADAELSLAIENFSKSLDIVNPLGIFKFLQKQQRIKAELGVKGEYVQLGDLYLYDWEDSNTTGISQLTLRSALSFITGKYASTTIATSNAKQLIINIFASCGITNYSIDDALSNVILNSYVGEIDKKQALQYILNASCAYIKVDRDGALKVVMFAEKLKEYSIGYDNMLKKPKITQNAKANYFKTNYVAVSGTIANPVLTETEVVKSNVAEGEMVVEKEVRNPFLASQTVAQTMLNGYALWEDYRLKYKIDWRQDMSVQAGDFTELQNDYIEQTGIITETQIDYDGTMSGNIVAYTKVVE